MNIIPEAFLKYASDILADTENGITGTQIGRYFSAKSIQENVNIRHSEQPFKDNRDKLVNKRTAFYQNLACFPPNLQYKIILEICDRFNKEGFEDLKNLTVDRYGDLEINETNAKVKKQVLVSKPANLTIEPNEYEEIITNALEKNEQMPVNQNTSQPINTENRPWYAQPKYFIPLLVAVIAGIFPLVQTYIQKDKPAKIEQGLVNRETFELILIDHATFKTPVFKIPNAKLKIYNSTPPTVIQIVDGTAKFESNPKLLENPVLIEFENISNYSMVDREHRLKIGRNEILIKKN